MSYSNNVYKYSSSAGPVSSMRVLVCVWKTYYYYCIINKGDVQACLVSTCIMYLPLSKIKCNSRYIYRPVSGDNKLSGICLPTSWKFPPCLLIILFGGWETLYKFYLSVFVLVFPFTQVVGILQKIVSILFYKTQDTKTQFQP